MRATHLLALTLVKHAAPVPTPDMYAAGMYMNPLIAGGGGAAIGALINALRGKGVGRGAMTGLATGLGTSIGAIGGTLGGAAVGSGGNPGLNNQHEMVNGMRVGAPVGALAGGGLGYALSHRSDEDEEREEREKKHKQPELKTAAAAEVPFYEDPANIGAVAGAAIGGSGAALLSKKKNKWRNALIAALAGGAAGYVAGPHVDKAVPQIRQGLGALSGAGAKTMSKASAVARPRTPVGKKVVPPPSRADFDGNAVGTSPDFLQALGDKMAPAKVVGKKTAQDAAPTTPFYKDPANIGAVAGATLAGGGAALLSKKNKWRNALIAALAGGAAGYVAGPHVDKAVPQIREGLGKVGDMIAPQSKPTPPVKPVDSAAAPTTPALTAPVTATGPVTK